MLQAQLHVSCSLQLHQIQQRAVVQVTALQIANLKKLNKRSVILLLDKSGTTSKAIAKELGKRGFKKVRVIQVHPMPALESQSHPNISHACFGKSGSSRYLHALVTPATWEATLPLSLIAAAHSSSSSLIPHPSSLIPHAHLGQPDLDVHTFQIWGVALVWARRQADRQERHAVSCSKPGV